MGADIRTVLDVARVVNVREGGNLVSQKVIEWKPSEGESPLDSKFNPDYAPLKITAPAGIHFSEAQTRSVPAFAGKRMAIFYFSRRLLKSRSVLCTVTATFRLH